MTICRLCVKIHGNPVGLVQQGQDTGDLIGKKLGVIG